VLQRHKYPQKAPHKYPPGASHQVAAGHRALPVLSWLGTVLTWPVCPGGRAAAWCRDRTWRPQWCGVLRSYVTAIGAAVSGKGSRSAISPARRASQEPVQPLRCLRATTW